MSHKRAHPFLALLRADFRMLRRHGILWLYLFLGLLYTALLRFAIPAQGRALWTALLLLTDPATMSLFFMGAIVLYEKNQGVHAALYSAGVRPRGYLFSKCLSAALIGMLVGCFVQWFSQPTVLPLAPGGALPKSLGAGDLEALCITAIGMLLGGIFFTCVSLLPATLAKTLNGFMTASAGLELLFLLPGVVELFYPLPEKMGYHPTVLLVRALYRPHSFWVQMRAGSYSLQLAAFFGWLLLALLGGSRLAGRLLRGKGGR